jgi:hypothetical protein
MKYLLFVYPCDTEWDSKNDNLHVAGELVTIIKSDEIKYIFGESHSVFHFESDMNQAELSIYVDLVMEETPTFMYVLCQTTKAITSNMGEQQLSDFLAINKRGRKRKQKENPIVNFFKKTTQEQFQSYTADLLNQQKKNIDDCLDITAPLTIDEILEKIHAKGIDSLTKEEKQNLDDYSKNQ